MQRKGYRRYERVGENLRQVIAEAIERRVDHAAIGLITVTEVDASPDLKQADVYVSVLGGATNARRKTLKALDAAAWAIQRDISRSMRIMWTPRLRFRIDDSPERADRIGRLLQGGPVSPGPGDDGGENNDP